VINLKKRLAEDRAILAPGAFDALSALLIEQAGMEAVYVSGASLAYTQLGRPDIGLLSLDHIADAVFRMRDRVSLPLIVDADTGFGNALNAARTVRVLERAGASAIQIEDQDFPKRCGHLDGKGLIPADEMVGKLKAALDARASDETLIVARTDAIGVEGVDKALERAHMYAETGVDVLFVEAPGDERGMRRVVSELGGKAPLLANMVEGGKTPLMSADQLSEIGFSVVILPGAMVRMLIPAIEDFLASIKANGGTRAFTGRMTDLKGVNARVGLDEMMALGAQYQPSLPRAAE
jgi:2-methylisocitrate lyase-like PEP mutase family enzyme